VKEDGRWQIAGADAGGVIGENLLNSEALNKGVERTDRRISALKSKKLVAELSTKVTEAL